MQLEYPPRLGWCTKHNSTTICKDCEIESLTARLAERDAEIETLRHQSINWVPVFDENMVLQTENAALREEVERLKERMHANAAKIDDEDVVVEWKDYVRLKEEARKQTAQEILD